MKKTSLSLLLVITWLIISTILLTIPGTKFPKDDWLSKIWFDKWVHLGMFALLVYLCCNAISSFNAVRSKRKNYFLWVALAALAYGIGMEFVQKYCISNRSFDGGDIIADAAGCIAGLLYSWVRYIKN